MNSARTETEDSRSSGHGSFLSAHLTVQGPIVPAKKGKALKGTGINSSARFMHVTSGRCSEILCLETRT